MADMINLRDYQREAIDRIGDAHASGMGFPAVVLPTGSGKTVIFAHQTSEHIEANNNRVLILVHRDELADQAIAKIRAVAPDLRVGKVKAEDDDVYADVVVASVQTASRPGRLEHLVASQSSSPNRRPRKFGLVITDEVHHCVAQSYRKIYDAFPTAARAGYTATLARGDGVGLGNVVDDVVFRRTWLWMIKRGYLVDPVSQVATVEDLDLSAVARSRGDYTASSLGQAMTDTRAHVVIARAYREHAADRRGIVFTPNVATAYLVSAELDRLGIVSDVVEANTSREERQLIYKRSRTGDLQVIVNCGVLTEGADFPWIDCVVPKITSSEPLFQQMVGRGLRTFPGKDDALILSIGGVSGRLRTLADLAPGEVRQVRPGESLAEAEAREEEITDAPVRSGRLRITVRHTDLFAASKSVWLRTEGGVMFIPVADGEVFLWPRADGLWQVRHAPHDTARVKVRWPVVRDGLTLDMAMAWGETEAEERDTGTGKRNARMANRNSLWRKIKEPPSAGQKAACEIRRIPVPDGATKAEISDVLSVWTATRKFDPFAARMAARDAAADPAVSAS